LFFAEFVRQDRNVVELLNANFTYVNERLAKHYEIPGIYGDRFRRIELPANRDMRRGLLGKGAIQLTTALADRTSPVERGKWVTLNILGSQPPEPPPAVPPLKESEKKNNGLVTALQITMRTRMEEHRANPVCAACHAKLDPIGFSMENFDAVGKWREIEAWGETVNAEGELADGQKFVGPSGLRTALLRYSPQFVRTITEKLMVYALGRSVAYPDMPVVRQIVRDAERNNYKFSSIILGIVKSQPFQMNQKAAETASR
jgi:hypothetical protein